MFASDLSFLHPRPLFLLSPARLRFSEREIKRTMVQRETFSNFTIVEQRRDEREREKALEGRGKKENGKD